MLSIVLVGGTVIIFILKSAPLDTRISEYVKVNLPFSKDYKLKQILLINKPDSDQVLIIKKILAKNKIKNLDYKMLRIVYNEFENNDTSYLNHVILNQKDMIISMDQPFKQ